MRFRRSRRSGCLLFLQNQFEKNVITTNVDYVFNWARKSASVAADLWAWRCRAIEMIASSYLALRFDIARFGAEVFLGRARGKAI